MKKIHIIGIAIIALAIAAIMSTVADSSTYASFSIAEKNPGAEYHVVGLLNKKKELIYNPKVNTNLFSFYLIDNDGKERKVDFNGTKPQDFERSEQIVIIGKMTGNVFSASSILMKCPSKYNSSSEMKEVKAS
jgi:cytochrome c-type biogenesis protein CcmE